MKNLRLYDEAQAELEKIFLDYAAESSGIAVRFYQDIVDSFSQLLRHPKIAPLTGQHHRKLVLRRFPYNIIYRESSNTLYIVAIARHRRMPGYWKDRN